MSQYYLTGALASEASASVIQQIHGQTLNQSEYVTPYEFISLGISPSAEYMLATSLYGTGAFDGSGDPYKLTTNIYQSSSANGYQVVSEILLKGYYDTDSGFNNREAEKNLTSQVFISDSEILMAGMNLDLDGTGQGGTEATRGYFAVVTGSGTSWGLHNYITGNASHSTTAQSRDANEVENGLGYISSEQRSSVVKTNNRFSSTAPTRAAVFAGEDDHNGLYQNVITVFQSGATGWSFHSQFSPDDVESESQGASWSTSFYYVKDIAFLEENYMAIIYHNHPGSNNSGAKTYRFIAKYNEETNEWKTHHPAGTSTTYFYSQQGTNDKGHEIEFGVDGYRWLEYDDANKVAYSFRKVNGRLYVEQYDSGSNWLTKFYPTGNNYVSDTPDRESGYYDINFTSTNANANNGNGRHTGWADQKHAQMWTDTNGNLSIISIFPPDSSFNSSDGQATMTFIESGSASGWNHQTGSYNDSVFRLHHFENESVLSGSGNDQLRVAHQRPFIRPGYNFAWNSLHGGDGNTLIWKEGPGSSGDPIGRLAIADLNAFPAANPSLDSSVSETVGSAGGSVSAGGTANAPVGKVEIPENALGGNVSISVDTSHASSSAALNLRTLGEASSNVIRLLPHGTQFSSAVTVTIRLKDGASTDNLQLLKRNSETGQWYNTGVSLSVSSGTVSFTTTSFSDYIVIGGQKVARTKINNIQLARIERSDSVLASAVNLTSSDNTTALSMIDSDKFLLQSASGESQIISASAMATYMSTKVQPTHIQTTDTDGAGTYRITFTDSTGTDTTTQIFTDGDLLFNASTNALSLGILSASSDISGSAALLVGSSATINDGLTVTAGGATVTAGGLSITAGGATITAGGAIVTGAVNMSSTLTAEGAVSGAAGTFDTLAGTSLALQGGGVSAAGAIAGATTVSGSGQFSMSHIDLDGTLTAGGAVSGSSFFDVVKDKLRVDGVAVTTTATELNMLDGSTLGSAVASKALVVDSDRNIGNINFLTASAIRVTDLDVVTINSISQTETTLEIEDKLIVASSGSNSANADGGGLQIGGTSGGDTVASVLYEHTGAKLELKIAGTAYARVDSGGLEAVGTLSSSAGLEGASVAVDGNIDSSGDLTAASITMTGVVSGSNFFDMVKDKLRVDGVAVTTTAAELNKLDGVTSTTTELNYVDVDTLGYVTASKAVVVDANKDAVGFRNLSASSNISASAYYGDGSNLTNVGATIVASSDLGIAGGLPLLFASASAGTSKDLFIDPNDITFNPGTNKFHVSGAISGSGGMSATSVSTDGAVTGGSLTDGTATLTGGALAGATTISGSSTISGHAVDIETTADLGGKLTVVGVSDLDGGIDVNASKFTVSTAGAVVADSTISGSDGSFDAITGVSLALQGGGITAAGAVAGATTVSGSGQFSMSHIDLDGTLTAGGVVSGSSFFDMVKDKLRIDGVAVSTTAAELNVLDGITATTSELNLLADTAGSDTALASGDAVIFGDASDSNNTKKATMQNVADLLGAGNGLQVNDSTAAIRIDYVCDIFSSASHLQDGLSLDMMTASLSATPLSSSLQVYLNGMLQVVSGAVDISSSAGIISAWDYKLSDGSSEFGLGNAMDTATKVIFAEAIDHDDVIQIKYIKK